MFVVYIFILYKVWQSISFVIFICHVYIAVLENTFCCRKKTQLICIII